MALNRLGFSNTGFGDTVMEIPASRLAGLSGLPFSLGQHGLQALQNSGNMDASAFTLHNNNNSHLFTDGLALFGQFGHIFPSLQQQHHHDVRQKPSEPPASTHSPNHHAGDRPTRSNDGNSGKSSSHYASRHQAAEQRRRTRINERLDLLRKLVPHSDRANTASFLEEVLKYIDSLKARVSELEQTLGSINAAGCKGPNTADAATTAPCASPTPPTRPEAQGAGFRGSVPHTGMAPGTARMPPGSARQVSVPQGLDVGYCLQQLQQQLLQQQHDATLSALQQQEEQHQQHKAAIMAAHQLRQQQEIAAVRQATQMADLASQLGLKTVPCMSQAVQGNSRSDPVADGQYPKHDRDARFNPLLLASTSAAPHSHTSLHRLPAQHFQLASEANDLGASAPTAANPAVQALKASTGSPVSSEESGVPLKKRKVLLL